MKAQIALDYNAPMLTLAAMHVLSDTQDPYFTTLAAGAYEKVKPTGVPCDAVFSEGCDNPHMSKKATVVLAVIVTIVGVIIFGLSTWYIMLLIRNSSASNTQLPKVG
jgi:endoglucanase